MAPPCCSQLLPLLLLLLVVTEVARCAVADVAELESQIKKIANDVLGVKKFQDYLDSSITYKESTLDVEKITNNVAQRLEARLQARFDAVRRLKTSIVDNYQNYLANMNYAPDCCTVPLPADEYAFRSRVNTNSMCSGGGKQNLGTNQDKRYPDASLYQAMKNNIEKVPTLKWQYFGSEEGTLFNYPAFRFCDDGHDPRFRPWYVETVTRHTKEVVIVIDTSASMSESYGSRTLLDIAKEAASTVVGTLNPNDGVAVVAFSNTVKIPFGKDGEDCYQTTLAQATPANREYLTKDFLASLYASGDSAYVPALNKAFQYFTSSQDPASTSTDKVILFLTDGTPSESKEDILNTISTENAKLSNKVVIMTYSMGAAATNSDVNDILDGMAKQTDHDQSAGNVKRGVSRSIINPDSVRYAMGTYYERFSFVDSQNSVTVSVPYMDAWGLGLVTSACMQVVVDDQVKGVTCADIVVDDLLSDLTNFHQGEFSYVFLMDELSRMYVHPLLPRPSNIKDDPVFVDFDDLERGLDAQAVKESMLKGESGTKTFSALLVRPRGDSSHEGVSHTTLETTYSWRKLPQTKFSWCVVIRSGDKQAEVEWQGDYPQNFLFHRLDVYQTASQTDSLVLCNHLSQIATMDHSAVFLSAGTFTEPSKHLQTTQTMPIIDGYASFFKDNSASSSDFRPGIRDSVAVTAQLDTIIPAFKASNFALWAFVATPDGVFRTIPATPHPQDYDPRLRPWYKRAMSERGRVVLSAPYHDAGGAGLVLTLSHAIYEGKSTKEHTDTDLPVAVMGLDITLDHLFELVQQSHPECNSTEYECFVMDNSGFVVVHEDFLSLSRSDSVRAENIHVTGMEPYIAEQLLKAGLMTKAACINYERTSKQYSWRVALGAAGTFKSNNEQKPFEVFEIDGTNVFLVKLVRSSARPYSDCTCRTPYGSTLRPCLSLLVSPADEFNKCECPCYRTAGYDACTDSFNKLDNQDATPPCTPETPSPSFNKYDREVLGDTLLYLPPCKQTCELIQDKRACLSVTDCGWCDTLQLCRLATSCSRVVPQSTGTVQPVEEDTLPVGAIAGGTVAGVVVLAVVALVVFILWKRHSNALAQYTGPSTNTHLDDYKTDIPSYGEEPFSQVLATDATEYKA